MSVDAVTTHDLEDVGNVTFSPPLYRQRYDFVASILREAKITSVVDIGCAECRALLTFRDIDSLQRIIGVDIDRQLLVDSAYRLKPRTCDYLFRRSNPLTVELYYGSLADLDERLCSVEAVSVIEVVEHLHEPVLSQLPTTIFGYIAPQVVIVTTPNAEFNVLFPTLTGFRHPDHKFEWTRQQFRDWCNNIVVRWNYSVEFGGIGNPPDAWTNVGHCSQYAVFTRQPKQTDTAFSASAGLVYEQLLAVDYPVKAAVSDSDAILHEAEYYIHFLAANANSSDDADDADDDGSKLISLHKLMTFSQLQQSCHCDINLLRCALSNAGFQLTADEESVIYKTDCDNSDDDDLDDNSCDTAAAADCGAYTSRSSDSRSLLDHCDWDAVVEDDWN